MDQLLYRIFFFLICIPYLQRVSEAVYATVGPVGAFSFHLSFTLRNGREIEQLFAGTLRGNPSFHE